MAIMAAQFSHSPWRQRTIKSLTRKSYIAFGASLKSPLSFTSVLKQVTKVIKDEMKDICGRQEKIDLMAQGFQWR